MKSLRKAIETVSRNAKNLNQAAVELSIVSFQASQATNQISGSMQQVAKGTQDQTDVILWTVSLVEQMAAAIDGVARGAQEQSLSVAKASQVTELMNMAIR